MRISPSISQKHEMAFEFDNAFYLIIKIIFDLLNEKLLFYCDGKKL